MNSVQVIVIVIAVIAFLWTIYVAFWSGERYMKWYLRNMRGGNYDLNRFKRIHVPFLFIVSVCFLLFGLNVKPYIPLFILSISMIIQFYLINRFGKKQE